MEGPLFFMTVWQNRGNDAPLVWDDRSPSTVRETIGGGRASFTIIYIDGLINWSPRFQGYGGSYGGLDVWQERTSGSNVWSER